MLQTFAGGSGSQDSIAVCGVVVLGSGLHKPGGPLEPDRALDPGRWALGAAMIRCVEAARQGSL
jgi:hypothetical protein